MVLQIFFVHLLYPLNVLIMKSIVSSIFVILILISCDKKEKVISETNQQEIATGLELFEGQGGCVA